MKYSGLICGGRGDNLWDKKFEVEADSFKEATEKVTEKLFDGDIVSMEEVD